MARFAHIQSVWRLMWLTAAISAPMLLGGCGSPYAGGPDGYSNIRPSWRVANAPIPVPHPILRPAPPVTSLKPSSSATAVSYSQTRLMHIQVAKGDTLYAIARRSGHSVTALIAANRLKPPYRLHVGQKLMLPAQHVHTVARGETSYGISRRYGVDVTSLLRVNDIGPPYTLAVGQRLVLPHAARPTQQPAQTLQVAHNSGGLIWPLLGQILSDFGPKPGGLHNDGINIAARRGEPVRAAADGTVAYVGNDLKGYGNLVLLRHDNGWITAYGHNEHVLVSKNQRVSQGGVIARAGASGAMARVQLHFEIRHGRRALDPMQYLPKLVSSAN